MNLFKSLFILVLLALFQSIDGQGLPWNFTTDQKIFYDGYPNETHTVTTTDGYILTIHRILPLVSNSKVVILQHGLLASSAHWVMDSNTSKNLAYILHNAGYDVWMPNLRGNFYSRQNVNLNPDAAPTFGYDGMPTGFWDFSFHEMGTIDLPNIIDYISGKTPGDKYYIGHSMGTTIYFIMASEAPQYLSKIKYPILLGPVAYTANMISPIRVLGNLLASNGITPSLLYQLGAGEYSPSGGALNQMFTLACTNATGLINFPQLCANYYFLQFGFDLSEFPLYLMSTILQHYPQGASTKTMLHIAQGVNSLPNSPTFTQFNYGLLGNIFNYGALFPPAYDLTKSNQPMTLFSADNDWLADPEDVKLLTTQLKKNFVANPSALQVKKVPYGGFNHADFVWANDVVSLLYNQLMNILNSN